MDVFDGSFIIDSGLWALGGPMRGNTFAILIIIVPHPPIAYTAQYIPRWLTRYAYILYDHTQIFTLLNARMRENAPCRTETRIVVSFARRDCTATGHCTVSMATTPLYLSQSLRDSVRSWHLLPRTTVEWDTDRGHTTDDTGSAQWWHEL
jgi:hypothetical protein